MNVTPYGALLAFHMAGGSLAVVAGSTAMLVTKGGRLHRRAGRLFAGCMLAIVLDALLLAVLKPNTFLFLIALFSLYLVTVGWRAARLGDARPQRLDWAMALGMLGVAVVMIVLGAAALGRGQSPRGPVLLVFSLIAIALSASDLRLFRRGGARGPGRIVRHLGHMTGGFIAAVTAATVVNAGFLPELARWLGPTLLLAPLALYWRYKLRRPALHRATT